MSSGRTVLSKLSLLFVFAALAASSASAHVIVLKNGRTVRAERIAPIENGIATLTFSNGGSMQLPAAEIGQILSDEGVVQPLPGAINTSVSKSAEQTSPLPPQFAFWRDRAMVTGN